MSKAQLLAKGFLREPSGQVEKAGVVGEKPVFQKLEGDNIEPSEKKSQGGEEKNREGPRSLRSLIEENEKNAGNVNPEEKSDHHESSKDTQAGAEKTVAPNVEEKGDPRGDSKDPVNAVDKRVKVPPKVNDDPRGDSKDPVPSLDTVTEKEAPKDFAEVVHEGQKKAVPAKVGGTGAPADLSSNSREKDAAADGGGSEKAMPDTQRTTEDSVKHAVDKSTTPTAAPATAEQNVKTPIMPKGKDLDSQAVAPTAEETEKSPTSVKAGEKEKDEQPSASKADDKDNQPSAPKAEDKDNAKAAGDDQTATEDHVHVDSKDLQDSRQWEKVQGAPQNSPDEEAHKEHQKLRKEQARAQYKWHTAKDTEPTIQEKQEFVKKVRLESILTFCTHDVLCFVAVIKKKRKNARGQAAALLSCGAKLQICYMSLHAKFLRWHQYRPEGISFSTALLKILWHVSWSFFLISSSVGFSAADTCNVDVCSFSLLLSLIWCGLRWFSMHGAAMPRMHGGAMNFSLCYRQGRMTRQHWVTPPWAFHCWRPWTHSTWPG